MGEIYNCMTVIILVALILTYFRGFIVLFTEVCLNLLLCFVRRG